MSIKARFDAVAARKYTTGSGEEKTQWINVGRAVEWDDGGVEIELNALPCFPGWSGKIKLFAQRDRQQSAPAARQSSPPPRNQESDGFVDDAIPF